MHYPFIVVSVFFALVFAGSALMIWKFGRLDLLAQFKPEGKTEAQRQRAARAGGIIMSATSLWALLLAAGLHFFGSYGGYGALAAGGAVWLLVLRAHHHTIVNP